MVVVVILFNIKGIAIECYDLFFVHNSVLVNQIFAANYLQIYCEINSRNSVSI